MSFEELTRTWNTLGKDDPFWAILTNPERKNGKWETEKFFTSGELEIDLVMSEIQLMDFPINYNKALDFGCGVGRLTQALGKHFVEVHGVDVASSMIELADNLNKQPEKVVYHLNQEPDLACFVDDMFDFIYSRIVLQHMHPVYSKQYIGEFIRVIKPGGLIAFQIPGGLTTDNCDEIKLCEYMQPSACFAASISMDYTSLKLKANKTHKVIVSVKNISQTIWQSEKSDPKIQIRLGNHWLHANGSMLTHDDGRAPIPININPGESANIELTIAPPEEDGDYLLELDMVQEGTAWFKEKGSSTLIIPVTVFEGRPSLHKEIAYPSSPTSSENGAASNTLPNSASEEASCSSKVEFEMHGVPPGEIVDVIHESNGRIFAIQPDGSAGIGWVSYFYYVTK